MDRQQIIFFKKNKELFSTREEALDAFRSMKFYQGEPVIALYGESLSTAKLLLAVGKRTAAGETAFDIVSTTGDIDQINTILSTIEDNLEEHEKTLSNNSTPGHVLSGDNIVFNNGIGIIKSLNHSLTFTGGVSGSFNGSDDVTIQIPQSSNELPLINGTASSGSENKWSRADHVHPEQVNIKGNSETTSKLKSPIKISISGGVSGSVTADFSKNVSISTTLSNHNHEISEINNLQESLDLKADLLSPTFTGVPKAPTANPGTNTDQVATTSFVISEIKDKIDAAIALRFKGSIGTSGTITSLPQTHITGDVYVSVDGAPSISGKKLEYGDVVICIKDGSESNDSDWTVVQANLDGAIVNSGTGVTNNVLIFSDNSGKIVKDSGLSISNIAKTSSTIVVGDGLTGGGNLGNEEINISHSNKPSDGEDAGGDGEFVTKVLIDSLGHVSGTIKDSLSGSVTANTGDYISSVTLSGNKLTGDTRKLPELSISNGSLESGKYISSINVSGHEIQVTKTSLPEESGKVKITSSGTAEYLIDKIKSEERAGNIYPVNVSNLEDTVKLSVKIDSIDSENNQVIKIKRVSEEGIIPENLEEGEIGINITDRYLYSSDGIETFRIYSNATSSYDGLMSKEDKSTLDQLNTEISENINPSINNLEEKLDEEISNRSSSINNLNELLNEEKTERINSDNSINLRIDTITRGSVTGIKMGSDTDIISPTSGIITLTPVSLSNPGTMTPEDKETLDSNNVLINSLPETSILDFSNVQLNSEGGLDINYTTITKNDGVYINGDNKKIVLPAATNVSQGILSSTDKKIIDSLPGNISAAPTDSSGWSISSGSVSWGWPYYSNVDGAYSDKLEFQIVFPIASSTKAGMMSGEDKNKIDNTIPDQISTEIQNRTSSDQNLQNQINKIGLSDGLFPDLSDTNYLSGKTDIISCLKALDSKIHEIEQSMITSIQV